MRAKDKGQGGVGTGVSGGQYTEKLNTAPGAAAQLTSPPAAAVAEPQRRASDTTCDCDWDQRCSECDDLNFPMYSGPRPAVDMTVPVPTDLATYAAVLAKAPLYRKTSVVQAKQATEPGRLTTVLADGTVETEKDYQAGDWIVTNPGGEQYTMSADKFAARYDALPNGTFQAKGKVQAVQYTGSRPIEIDSPWGEKMVGNPGCWIVQNPEGERYIIGKDEFAETYAPDAENAAAMKELMDQYVSPDASYVGAMMAWYRHDPVGVALEGGDITPAQAHYLVSGPAQADKTISQYEEQLGPARWNSPECERLKEGIRQSPIRDLRISELRQTLQRNTSARRLGMMDKMRIRAAEKALEKAYRPSFASPGAAESELEAQGKVWQAIVKANPDRL